MSNQISLFFREDDNLIFAKNLKEFYYVLNDGLDIFKLCLDVFHRLYVESIKTGQKLYDEKVVLKKLTLNLFLLI